MWLLDMLRNPLWYWVSRLALNRRRLVSTALCSYDFLRQQVEKKLVAPAEAFLKENPHVARTSRGKWAGGLITELADEAMLGLLHAAEDTPPGQQMDPNMKAVLNSAKIRRKKDHVVLTATVPDALVRAALTPVKTPPAAAPAPSTPRAKAGQTSTTTKNP